MKILKTKIIVKFLILLLLQITYIFTASTEALNVLQISAIKQILAISFTLLQVRECMG